MTEKFDDLIKTPQLDTENLLEIQARQQAEEILKTRADQIDYEASVGGQIEVPLEVADYMGVFEEDALSPEEALMGTLVPEDFKEDENLEDILETTPDTPEETGEDDPNNYHEGGQ